MSKSNNGATLHLGESLSLKAKDGQHGKEVEISFKHGIINFNTSVPVSSILNAFFPVIEQPPKVNHSNSAPKATSVPKKRK